MTETNGGKNSNAAQIIGAIAALLVAVSGLIAACEHWLSNKQIDSGDSGKEVSSVSSAHLPEPKLDSAGPAIYNIKWRKVWCNPGDFEGDDQTYFAFQLEAGGHLNWFHSTNGEKWTLLFDGARNVVSADEVNFRNNVQTFRLASSEILEVAHTPNGTAICQYQDAGKARFNF